MQAEYKNGHYSTRIWRASISEVLIVADAIDVGRLLYAFGLCGNAHGVLYHRPLPCPQASDTDGYLAANIFISLLLAFPLLYSGPLSGFSSEQYHWTGLTRYSDRPREDLDELAQRT
ncbi:hypothetical protein BD309DRAFT_462461 [Dichomitus squalens]|nr:hypothetical protein BD309DRAFT_462461 [Dichomitus squalens]